MEQEKLRRALRAVRNDNQKSARRENDTIKSAIYDAKIQLCEELAAALGLELSTVNCDNCRATNNPRTGGVWECEMCGHENNE